MQLLQDRKKVDYYDKLFEDVQEINNSRQTIDNAPKTEDIFINDELFSSSDKKDIKTLVDVINTATNEIQLHMFRRDLN